MNKKRHIRPQKTFLTGVLAAKFHTDGYTAADPLGDVITIFAFRKDRWLRVQARVEGAFCTGDTLTASAPTMQKSNAYHPGARHVCSGAASRQAPKQSTCCRVKTGHRRLRRRNWRTRRATWSKYRPRLRWACETRTGGCCQYAHCGTTENGKHRW